MLEKQNNIMIYEDKDGVTKVSVKFIDEDIWLTQIKWQRYINNARKYIYAYIKYL